MPPRQSSAAFVGYEEREQGHAQFHDYVEVQLYPKNIDQYNLLEVITSEKGAAVTAARITIVTESKLGE
jgi:hypothetical protein